jgi:hypothetical protein
MAARCEFIAHSFGQILDQPPNWGNCDLNYCFLQSENLAGPIAADQIRPHIVRDRAVRAWLGEDCGRATLAARLNSCSQPSAELFVLLLETSHSLHAAFFNDKIAL